MPWMCLERCGNTTVNDIYAQVTELAKRQSSIYAVAFERFNLGPNGTLVLDSNLTHVAPLLRFAGFSTIAMVSSWPYPKDFLLWMRALFVNPYPFIGNLTQALVEENIDGVNIDFEPTAAATSADAAAFAQFLETLRLSLGESNKTVSVDAARWNDLWNYTALSSAMNSGAPSVTQGVVATMSTYVSDDSVFLKEAIYATNHIAAGALVLGMESTPQLTVANVTYRFKVMQALGVNRAGVWRVPLPAFWWPIIQRFVNGTL